MYYIRCMKINDKKIIKKNNNRGTITVRHFSLLGNVNWIHFAMKR